MGPDRRARWFSVRLLGVAFVHLGYVLFAHGLIVLGVHVPHPTLPHFLPLELQGGEFPING